MNNYWNSSMNTNRQSIRTSIKEITVNGNMVTGDENIANEFNEFFSTIGPKLAKISIPNKLDPLHFVSPKTELFNFEAITNEQLSAALKKLKMNKASGLDKISNKLLKAAGNTIVNSLAYIFYLSLNTRNHFRTK